MRLDVAVVARGLLPSRAKAQQALRANAVLVNGAVARKTAMEIGEQDDLALAADYDAHYVGRGARKLCAALDAFAIDVRGLTCADIGASTGGFTQVLLERGAAQVFAADVGKGQLAPSLRADPRVQNLEQCDARNAPARIGTPVDFLCADVSFISLKLLYAHFCELLVPGANAVCLLKPQFEAGPQSLDKRGVVRDRARHAQVLEEARATAGTARLTLRAAIPSPIRGGDGNVEYLLHFQKMTDATQPPPAQIDMARLVRDAWEERK